MAATQKVKVLIIEDNVDLSEMFRIKFEHDNFEVKTALDGEKGILAAVEYKPDVILLDILMPNMDGFEVLKAIKDNTKLDCKIIILSNLGQPEQIDHAFELGATEYLVKANHQPSDVVTRVKEIVGMASTSQATKNSDDVTVKLIELKKLLDEGAISQDEFEKVKKKLLGES